MEYISISAEMDRISAEYSPASGAEIKTICPFHADSSPSLYVNTESKLCKCHACGWEGTFIGYLAKTEDKLLAEVQFDLEKRYGISTEKSINPVRIEKAHGQIWAFKHFIQELEKRGVGLADIKKHKIGVERNRITIPIPDEKGFYVNLRKYLPGAESSKKFRDEKGCGKVLRLFPVDQLQYDRIVVCSGEIKAISAAGKLNPAGIGAISATGGEHRWSSELTDRLIGKIIYIAYDVDDAGVSAALLLARQIAAYVKWCGIIKLPLDKERFPKGGIDDFIANGGDILKVVDQTEEFVLQVNEEKDYCEPAERFESLTKVIHSENVGTRITADCVVTSMDTVPYAVPKKVAVKCTKNIDWCALCRFHPLKEEDMVQNIHPENPTILDMIDTTAKDMNARLKEAMGIPSLCGVCSFNILEFQHAEDCRISENLDVAKRTEDKSMIPAVCVADEVQLNEPYTVEGRLLSSPKTAQSVLLISKVDKKDDCLSSFNSEGKEHLQLFQPKEWTLDGLQTKLNHIYDDLEANVTKIYSRRLMHLICDLTYHSPLFIDFRGKQVKGWVESLIVGDSSQGKTECALNLQQHYRLGSWLSCKGASVAGILGGLQQVNKKWFITWGAMPTQDRRLLVLEELKGMESEMFAKLTDTRSSGIAEIVKIERRRTYSRVRLLALSNPRSERPVNTYNSGVDVIKELIGSLEDIRRFDAFYVINKEDIDIEEVIGTTKNVEHVYDSESCRDLVLWAWTLRNTIFEDEDYLLHKSIEFGKSYSDNIPIYDRGSGRYKIARLAAALAARTYSNDGHDRLYIRKCHVDYVCNFLSKIYNSKTFGYKSYSDQQKEIEKMVDPDKVLRKINATAYPIDLCKQILGKNSINVEFVHGIIGGDKETIASLLSFLLRHHCLRRGTGKDNSYFKTGTFVDFLRDGLDNNEITNAPSHIDVERDNM